MAEQTDTDKPTIVFDDFTRLDLRVATITAARLHPNADRLLVLELDVAGQPRQICAGVRGHYEPEALVNRQIVIVANLEPRKLRGETSQGMLLAASHETDDGETQIVLLRPDHEVNSGSAVS